MIASKCGIARPSAGAWLKGNSTPSDENHHRIQNLIEHCLNRMDKPPHMTEVFNWLIGPTEINPFEQSIKVYDHALITAVYAAIQEVANSMDLDLESVKSEKFENIFDTVIENSAKHRTVSKELIRRLFILL